MTNLAGAGHNVQLIGTWAIREALRKCDLQQAYNDKSGNVHGSAATFQSNAFNGVTTTKQRGTVGSLAYEDAGLSSRRQVQP